MLGGIQVGKWRLGWKKCQAERENCQVWRERERELPGTERERDARHGGRGRERESWGRLGWGGRLRKLDLTDVSQALAKLAV